jgi:hypothetical protein
MNNLLSPAINRHLKGLLLLVLLFGSEFVKNCEHGGWSLFELASSDSTALSTDPGEECEGESGNTSFPGSSGDDEGGFHSTPYLDFTGNPACPFFTRLVFAASSAAVQSSENRLFARTSVPLFILHGTFRGALPA